MNIIITESQLMNTFLMTEERLSQLILEGKDPVELLKYKFGYIPEELIKKMVDIDPTKKKSYSQWLCKQWKGNEDYIIQNLDNGNVAKLFHFCKEHPDIQIKDIPSIEEGIKMYVAGNSVDSDEDDDSVLGKSSEPETYLKNLKKDVDSRLANDFDVVFDEDDWLIAVPHTYEAECKLGEGMKWCTANAFGNGKQYYDNYLGKGGKYYVNFDMSEGEKGVNGIDYPYKRYQFHFESNQFMDKNDNPVTFEKIKLPDSAYHFYEDEGYDMSQYGLDEEERADFYEVQRDNNGMNIAQDLDLLQEYDDDYDFEEPDENTLYYLFDRARDDRDPIDWQFSFHKTDDVIQFINEEQNVVVLKNTDGDYCVAFYEDYSWNVMELQSFKPYGEGAIGMNNQEIGYFSSEGSCAINLDEDAHVEGQKYVNYFVNDKIIQNGVVVEAVTDNGFHSLVELSPARKIIIALDVPENGKIYTIGEDGRIHGKFRTYSIDGANSEDGGEPDFQVIEKLNDNKVVVEFTDGEEEGTKNIFDLQTRKFICPFNFMKYLSSNEYGYFVSGAESLKWFISNEGKKVGSGYENMGVLKNPNLYYGRKPNNGTWDIIDLSSEAVLYSVRNINAKFGVINNNIMSVDLVNGANGVLVYMNTGEQVIPGYSDFMKLSRSKFVFGAKDGVYTMFETDPFKALIGGITNVNTLNRLSADNPVKLTFVDGTCNILNPAQMKLLLPKGVTMIDTSTAENAAYDISVFPYELGDKLFFYSSKSNSNIINPNGLDKEYEKKYRMQGDGNIVLTTTDGAYTFLFNKQGIPMQYNDNSKSYGRPVSIQGSGDMKMLQWLSNITGQDYMKDAKEEVKESFMRMFGKLL